MSGASVPNDPRLFGQKEHSPSDRDWGIGDFCQRSGHALGAEILDEGVALAMTDL